MKPNRTIRRGISMLELLCAAAVISVLIAFVFDLLMTTARQHQASDKRALATHELSNIAERIAMLSYEQTTQDRLDSLEVSPTVKAILPDAALQFDISEEAGDLPAKRIDVALAWGGETQAPARPLRLVIWKYQTAEATP